MVTLIIIFSNNIVSLLDKRYEDASIVMVVMLFAMLIDCYRTMFMNPLSYNLKYVKVASLIWTFTALFNIGLNLYLIPKYSIYGACFAMVLSYFLTFILIIYYARKAYYVDYDIRSMLKVFMVSMLACLSFMIGSALVLLPIKFLIVFVYIFVITKIMRVNAIKHLLEYRNKIINK